MLVPLQRMSVVLTAPCSLLCALSPHAEQRGRRTFTPTRPASSPSRDSPCTESMFDAGDGLRQASERVLFSRAKEKDASPDPEIYEQKKAYHYARPEDKRRYGTVRIAMCSRTGVIRCILLPDPDQERCRVVAAFDNRDFLSFLALLISFTVASNNGTSNGPNSGV